MININFVWIGDGPINPLGMLNLHAWCSKPSDWIVNVVWLPNKGSAVTSPLDRRVCAGSPCPHLSRLNVVRLEDYLASALVAERMPGTAGLIQALIDNPSDDAARAYAIGDLTKSLLAGTAVGVTLDLKIGPSAPAKTTPHLEATFNKFTYMERCGVVENQCMGSFVGDYTKIYGETFEASVSTASFVTPTAPLVHWTSCGKQNDFTQIFGAVTAMHAKVVNKLKVKGHTTLANDERREAWAFTTTGLTKDTKYCEDPGNKQRAYDDIFKWDGSGGVVEKCHGPFQVFQKNGWYNWRPTSVKAENMFYVASVLRHAYLNRRLYGIDFHGNNPCSKACATEYCKSLLQEKFWKTNE